MSPDAIIVPSILLREWNVIILEQPHDYSWYKEEYEVVEVINWTVICRRLWWWLANVKFNFGFYEQHEDWHFSPIIIKWL